MSTEHGTTRERARQKSVPVWVQASDRERGCGILLHAGGRVEAELDGDEDRTIVSHVSTSCAMCIDVHVVTKVYMTESAVLNFFSDYLS